MLTIYKPKLQTEKMNAIWISLKGNIKCGSKITDVAMAPTLAQKKEKLSSSSSSSSSSERNPHITNRFQELGMGEPSRNVVEMIFGASAGNPKKRGSSRKKIKRVLKVNNPSEVVAKFESYREEVKKSWSQHPRISVDGNEVLQFYGTTMTCCSSSIRRNTVLSQVCSDAGCRVCRVIESGFDTCYNKMHGVRVSSRSCSMSEEVGVAGKKNAKRGVIICRAIAAGAQCVGDDCILVPNPTALLPCFVVLFD